MTEEIRYAYSEVVEILSQMEYNLVSKVPIRLRNFFTFNKLPNYQNHIDMKKPLTEQNLKPRTKCILAFLNYKYWTESEKHKKELIEKYETNDKNRRK